MHVTKQEFVDRVADKAGLSKRDASDAVDAFLHSITDVLRSGGELRRHVDATGAFRFDSLPGGTFDLLVWSRGHRPQVVAEVALGEGEERELGTLRLAP